MTFCSTNRGKAQYPGRSAICREHGQFAKHLSYEGSIAVGLLDAGIQIGCHFFGGSQVLRYIVAAVNSFCHRVILEITGQTLGGFNIGILSAFIATS